LYRIIDGDTAIQTFLDISLKNNRY